MTEYDTYTPSELDKINKSYNTVKSIFESMKNLAYNSLQILYENKI